LLSCSAISRAMLLPIAPVAPVTNTDFIVSIAFNRLTLILSLLCANKQIYDIRNTSHVKCQYVSGMH